MIGVLIDRNVLFSNQIYTACKKAGMQVSVLMRMRNKIAMKVKLKGRQVAISDILQPRLALFVEAQTGEIFDLMSSPGKNDVTYESIERVVVGYELTRLRFRFPLNFSTKRQI